MNMNEIFCGLPYGFSAFSEIKDSLIACRALERLPENAETVISVLFPYYLGEEYYEKSNVSRYAVSEDYHIVTAKILSSACERLSEFYPENRFEWFADNSPIPEVRAAVNAGLGVMGKNNLFINRDYGSWVFLGEIVTDRYFEPAKTETSFCISCGRCEEACPMGAITGEGINRENCLSFLSQKKGELPELIKQKMLENGCLWGCDICQKVCPCNINAKTTPIKEFYETARPVIDTSSPIENRAYAWRGRAVIERNLELEKR